MHKYFHKKREKNLSSCFNNKMDNQFDIIIDRRDTSSLKWDKYKGTDIIPMWVADMDFKSPEAVIDQLTARVEHAVFGYTKPPEELKQTVVKRLHDRFGWEVDTEWMIWLPGLVCALHLACRAAGEPGDEIITFTPVYPPFFTAPSPDQKLIEIPLEIQDNRYTFDLEKLKQSITPRSKLLMLCNPHNPVGRAYSREELKAVTEICLENNIKICSDEIHCELILDDKKHIPAASISEEVSDSSITLMSPSKTFNLAGLNCSFAIIPNPSLRQKFARQRYGIVPHVNALGYTAALAAYRDSDQWHKQLLEYLKTNRDIVEDFIAQTPVLSMTHVETTYLAWIDVSRLNLSNPVEFFENAGVGLSDGKKFGGETYLRLNFGCPKELLTEALKRIDQAIKSVY